MEASPTSEPEAAGEHDLIADLVRRTELVAAAATEAVSGLDDPAAAGAQGGTEGELTGAIVERLRDVHAECERIHGILDRVSGMIGEATPQGLAAAPTKAVDPAADAAESVATEPEAIAAMAPPTSAPVHVPGPADEEPQTGSEPDIGFESAADGELDADMEPNTESPTAVPADQFTPPTPDQRPTTVSYPGTAAPEQSEESALGRPPSEGIRLLATQMAVAGESREDIEHRLRSDFGVADADLVVRELFG